MAMTMLIALIWNLGTQQDNPTSTVVISPAESSWLTDPDPLQIEQMRRRSYPGSPITFERNLTSGSNYDQYVVSYLSDGFKIYALMTIPQGEKPATGWPVIVFNHGYIAPSVYRTTERYVAYVDTLAKEGYIVFKSDYRGHGSSEGGSEGGGGYGTPGYTVDVLNATAALKAYPDADPNRIGMWGHSMGGQITLRAMVVSEDIDAGVIWAGVVAPYPIIIERWGFNERWNQREENPESAGTDSSSRARGWAEAFATEYGTPIENPLFWASISPNTYLADLSGPLQIHHSTTDETVPIIWSEILVEGLQATDQFYQFYIYEGDDHNIATNFNTAMQRTLAFFDEHVRNKE
jgi:dipeptidyl aminopeptidase/acylaminoacyl peptidase